MTDRSENDFIRRTGAEAIRAALQGIDQGKFTNEEAIMSVQPNELATSLGASFSLAEKNLALEAGKLIGGDLSSCPGAGSGKIALDAETAIEWADAGEPVVLVREETTPEDVHAMKIAQAIITAKGSMSSHAALVARQLGKPCVAGWGNLRIDLANRSMSAGAFEMEEGDLVSVDGYFGQVIVGALSVLPSPVLQSVEHENISDGETTDFHTFLRLADDVRRMGVRANADRPDQCKVALALGAEGVGVCRTEHMFFGPDRIQAMRKMILASDHDSRLQSLESLKSLQRDDFIEIFQSMRGRAVTIRLLDPPLHEFLPAEPEAIRALAAELGVEVDAVLDRISQLRESNPMLGHRGCRLAIAYPEITRMQAAAILEAAITVQQQDVPVEPEIMIPIVSAVGELENQKAIVDEVAEEIRAKTGVRPNYEIGTMIELPRACMTAERIAEQASFFSFGTNDLTQTVFGISRDDSEVFLPNYIESGILAADPFASIDVDGVGALMKEAIKRGRETKPELKIGICGEHGGEPESIAFCHDAGVDYVSCSPYRIPIARLAAAQATLRRQK